MSNAASAPSGPDGTRFDELADARALPSLSPAELEALLAPGNVIDLDSFSASNDTAAAAAANADDDNVPANVPAPAAAAPASLLPATQARLLRRLPQAAGEVWHVAVRRLRCFALPVEGGALHEVSRPRALIVARLGQPSLVLRCVSLAPAPDLSGAPVGAASSFSVLEQVARCIVAPRAATAAAAAAAGGGGGKGGGSGGGGGSGAHRPATVTFEDGALAAGCAATLAALDVRCAALRAAPQALDRFVSDFSEALIARRVAVATPQSQRMPPLCEPGSGVTDSHVRALLGLGRRFVAAAPWLAAQGKQTFRIRLAGAGAGAGEPRVAWANVLGFDHIQRRQQVLRDSGGDVAAMMKVPLERGIRVFFKRYDAEQRLLTALPTPERPVSPMAPPAEPNPADLVCAQCGRTVHAAADAEFARSSADEGDAAAVEQAYLNAQKCFQRCVGCREVYYCAGAGGSGGGGGGGGDAAATTCQRQHWPTHRAQCQARRSPEWTEKAGPDSRPGFWPQAELICIFSPLHMMCFPDLERFERLGFVAPNNIGDLPCPLTFVRGMPRRPAAGELLWIMRAMAAVIEFARQRPDLLNDTFSANSFSHAEHEEELLLAAALPAARSAEAAAVAAVAAASEPPWYEAFGESAPPVAHVRADAILTAEEAKNQRMEVADVALSSHDERAIKPGVYVPSRASLLDVPSAAVGGGASTSSAGRCSIS